MLEQITYELLLGLVCLGLALAFPNRGMQGQPEWGWDLFGYVAVTAYLFVYATLVDAPPSSMMESLEAFGQWQTAVFEPISPWTTALLYIVIADFGVYWAHRALHHRWLWNQHAWHHSSTYLYVGSGMRGTIIHAIVTALPYTLTALIVPVFAYDELFLYILLLDIANQQYIHSNIHIPGARWLEKVLVTPRMHQVHHHANPLRTNSNYGFIFSVWDRLFGTYTDPDILAGDEPLGLDYPISKWRLFFGLPARVESNAALELP
ncbi:MAG: sterol desaturase family protein [Hahellaceae bacterium]|nr:sterol desaturase family protein [Hahellaceae bacterium]